MKAKQLRVLVRSALLLAAVAVLWPRWSEFWAVDACLDSGGSYNYDTQQCDHEQSHPYKARSSSGTSFVIAGFLAICALAAPTVIGRRVGNSALQQGASADVPAVASRRQGRG